MIAVGIGRIPPLRVVRVQHLIGDVVADKRLLWQLLGQLDDDELLIEIPGWLAEEKVGYVDGSVPTLFVGQIARETEKAIQFANAASAGSILKLTHRIHQLEEADSDADQDDWLGDRLRDHRRAFERREDAVKLQDEWLPKSQIVHAVRRRR